MKLILVLVFSLFVSAAQAQAASINVDLDKVSPEVASKVIAEQQRIAKEAADRAAKTPVIPSSVAQAVEWSNVGQNLAMAVATTARALSIEANEFIKTPVGWWTFAFIFWYFLGKTMWHIVGGCLIWFCLGSVIWHSFATFHIPRRRVLDKTNGVITYKYVQYEFNSKEARATSACFHVGAFIVLSIVMLCIIFN